MELKELKLGNYCYCQDEINVIYGITKEGFVQYEKDNNVYYCGIDELKPIELTEEILFKCGFEKFEDHNKYGWYLKVDNRYLCWCFNEYISLEFTENQAYLNYNDTLFDYPCKYLHQLQNIYFALTSEELEIKL